LACACKESPTFLHKLEQLYAFFVTAGEDTRIFGLHSTTPVMRGRSSTFWKALFYRFDQLKTFWPAPRRSSIAGGLPEGSRVVHPTHGGGVVVGVDHLSMRERPVTVHFDNGEVHQYSLDSAIKKLKVLGERRRRERTRSLSRRNSSKRTSASPSISCREASPAKDQDDTPGPESALEVVLTAIAHPKDAAEARPLDPPNIPILFTELIPSPTVDRGNVEEFDLPLWPDGAHRSERPGFWV
jgi:hypothetical protein